MEGALTSFVDLDLHPLDCPLPSTLPNSLDLDIVLSSSSSLKAGQQNT
jgi:hypothetical protein